MFEFNQQSSPFIGRVEKMIAEQRERAAEEERKQAEWQAMPLAQKALVVAVNTVKYLPKTVFYYCFIPTALYLLYAALVRLGEFRLPGVPSIWAFYIPFWMYRVVLSEIFAQIAVNRRNANN